MQALIPQVGARLAALPIPILITLPDGQDIGVAQARVHLRFLHWSGLARLASGQIGAVGEDYVEGGLEIDATMRDLMVAATALLPGSPVQSNTRWWTRALHRAKSLASHTRERDAEQIQYHYDVSDAFYALWLDPRRVYSCAYYREDGIPLAQAQEAKLDHICRKLRLQPGERFLDIGSGWGALLLWAAEHYGVDATGITLSRNQHAYVQRLIDQRGLSGRVRVELRDYRDLQTDRPFDKVSSVGMFEHVGQANMTAYFQRVRQLVRPGGLVLNHGITAGGLENTQLGAGMGEFIEKYIFPGGELLHISPVLHHLAQAGLEMVDVENLRPHYAKTLWAWSDALESQLGEAQRILAGGGDERRALRVLRAYRLYLAGSAMSFEQGWISLHQILATRPDGDVTGGNIPGAQSVYPFNRSYMYR
jgi:cyclopropane-fatty-acyl-phospholipid synthase